MERVQRDTSATIRNTFQVDGAPTDPSPVTATIEVLRADGTVLVPAGTATTYETTGQFAYTLTPTHTEQLDELTVRWTATLNGFEQTVATRVQVVGGFLFTISDLQGLLTASKVSGSFDPEQIIEVRTLVEQSLEDACGVAFVPRHSHKTFSGTGAATAPLKPLATRVQWLVADGAAVDAGTLAGLRLDNDTVYASGAFTTGWSNYTIGYEHGHAYPPERVKRAAMLLAKNWLVQGPVDDRTTSMSTEDGTFTLATPGMRGSTFGIPEVDAVVQEYGRHYGI